MENLFLPKVLYVTKGCLKNLARAKNVMRAQKRKNAIFGAINFTPLQVPDHSVPVSNQACGGTQNSLNRDLFQYLTSKHDVHTSGTLRTGFADFLPQKFLPFLSNLLKYAYLLFFTVHRLKK